MTFKNIFSFAIGPLGLGVLGIITVPILTWSFSVDDVGRFTMVQTIISFMCLILGLGLDQAFVREFYETKNLPSLLKHTFIPGFFLLIVIFLFLPLFKIDFSNLLFDCNSSWAYELTAACVLSTFISGYCSYILRMQEKGLLYSFSMLAPKAFFLLLLCITFYIDVKRDFSTLLCIQFISLFLTMLYLLFITLPIWYRAYQEKISTKTLKPLLLYGLPLVLGSLSYWGLTSIDRVALRSWSSLEELGKYAVAVNFAAVGIMFNKIFSTVWLPIMYRWAADGIDERKVDLVVERVLTFVVFAFSGIGIFSWVIDFILPESYGDVKFIVVACLGFPLLYALSETTVVGVNVSRKTIYSMLSSVGAFAVNLFSNYFLIPKFGASGAAVSTAIGFLFFLILRTEFSVRVWRPFPRLKIYIFSFLCVFISAIEALFHKFLNVYIYLIWLLFLFTCLYFFKDTLLSLWRIRNSYTYKPV